ncbi:MAG: Holliday junction branch migration protein RuvA [Rhodothermales bacterium]
MYAYVSGTLVEKRPTEAVIDVQGIGYRMQITTSTFEQLPPLNKPVKLFTYFHVREDASLLFGFASRPEKRVFEVMLGVSGIGPKLALAALSAMKPDDLRAHVIHGETAVLTSIPGVGRKTAQRLIVELKDRFADMEPIDEGAGTATKTSDPRTAARSDALAALESLGFARATAEKHLRSVLKKNPDVSVTEEMIRLVLREQ